MRLSTRGMSALSINGVTASIDKHVLRQIFLNDQQKNMINIITFYT
ncbi:MAG: Unknown protein [uncultured Thiotrichaceae bacterium]|uniref:Uncharacterized protein n=1 Tax=uncultured Thiotrichaceae bacterium TaxID=298394 RepID=A0A6S6UF72_9GAMM|nr:MAG: Unknown protein [uncultured Thiotrichaceae bacterium]